MTVAPPHNLNTVHAIAEHFHVHVQTVRQWIKRGDLGSVHVGRYTYVSDEQLAKFIDARTDDA